VKLREEPTKGTTHGGENAVLERRATDMNRNTPTVIALGSGANSGGGLVRAIEISTADMSPVPCITDGPEKGAGQDIRQQTIGHEDLHQQLNGLRKARGEGFHHLPRLSCKRGNGLPVVLHPRPISDDFLNV